MTVIVPKDMFLWNLVQLRAAIRCEKAGMKHSSGRSARKRACIWLEIPVKTPHDEVIKLLTACIEDTGESNADAKTRA